MFTRTLTSTYEVPVPLPAVWDYLTDPTACAAQSTHSMWAEKSDHGFRVGTTWLEHHTDDCGSDPVRWTVRSLEPERRFTVQGLQSGARQRATTSLEPVAGGTRVTSELEISTTLRARATLTERLILPVMLATGLGISILAEGFQESVDDDRRYLEAVAAGSGGR